MIQPSAATLAWAAAAAGSEIHDIRGLRDGGSPWLLRLTGGPLEAVVLRTGAPGPDGPHAGFAAEAAALELAAGHRLPAPRLIAADPDGRSAGTLAVLTTAVRGSSRIPALPTPGRLRALGAAAAALHAVPLDPRPGLPLRDRSIGGVDFAAMRRDGGLPPLLAEAERAVAGPPPGPGVRPVLVHGDLWQGNTLWEGETLTGIVDWDSAGAGHWGVDLGSLRCDAAVLAGPPAADEVLTGWLRAPGRAPQEADARTLAYWDVVAALSTPPDLALWLPAFAGQGRGDLSPATATGRRDAFLRGALDRLGRGG
ncbi:phosphotransferase [Streptomyces sp. NPDC001985]|uniref:phosphotransferase n=1 Tax=Streptomyces sp. NPDC001985 TaxID=3154406 RepID=UPI00331B68F5